MGTTTTTTTTTTKMNSDSSPVKVKSHSYTEETLVAKETPYGSASLNTNIPWLEIAKNPEDWKQKIDEIYKPSPSKTLGGMRKSKENRTKKAASSSKPGYHVKAPKDDDYDIFAAYNVSSKSYKSIPVPEKSSKKKSRFHEIDPQKMKNRDSSTSTTTTLSNVITPRKKITSTNHPY